MWPRSHSLAQAASYSAIASGDTLTWTNAVFGSAPFMMCYIVPRIANQVNSQKTKRIST